MTGPDQDIWSQWLLHRRFGGDAQRMQVTLGHLYRVRDKVLCHAGLGERDVLLDVGCGDGFIGFGALEKAGAARVIFSDISGDLLNRARSIAQETGVGDRCQFFQASADDLSALPDACVDVVTTRSVLVYVAAKARAFKEFHRVLKAGGRVSLFEPINRFAHPEPAHLFWGYDVTPAMALAQKVKAVYLRRQPPDTDPMLDFDERDLLRLAEQAGFGEIHLELEAEIKSGAQGVRWETYWPTAPNPKAPTIQEAVGEALTSDEAERFVAHLRPLVEAGTRLIRSAVAYLWAVKQGPPDRRGVRGSTVAFDGLHGRGTWGREARERPGGALTG